MEGEVLVGPHPSPRIYRQTVDDFIIVSFSFSSVASYKLPVLLHVTSTESKVHLRRISPLFLVPLWDEWIASHSEGRVWSYGNIETWWAEAMQSWALFSPTGPPKYVLICTHGALRRVNSYFLVSVRYSFALGSLKCFRLFFFSHQNWTMCDT